MQARFLKGSLPCAFVLGIAAWIGAAMTGTSAASDDSAKPSAGNLSRQAQIYDDRDRRRDDYRDSPGDDRPGDYGRGDRNPEGKRASCDTYAKLAVVQAEANQKYDCNLRGPEWSLNTRGHYEWCMFARREFLVDQLRYRAQELQKCFNNLGDYDDDRWDRSYRRRF